MKKATCNGRGGPSPALSQVEGCPPVRRADTQVGPYTRTPIDKRPRRPKWAGLFAIVVVLTVCGARAEAQQPGKIIRIGFLDSSTASGSAVLVDAFKVDYARGDYRLLGDTSYMSLFHKAPPSQRWQAFLDFFLDEESMSLMAKNGEFVNRKGVYPPVPDAGKIKFVEMDDLGKTF